MRLSHRASAGVSGRPGQWDERRARRFRAGTEGARALQRYFRCELGISPKRFARIVRLNTLLATLDAGDRESAVDLALELGFFDQPHMLRELRLLAGRRLSAQRESDGELARHFTAPERLRRLLVGAYAEPGLSLSSKRRS